MNTGSNAKLFRSALRPLALLVILVTSGSPVVAQEWRPGDALPDLAAYPLEGAVPDLEGKVALIDFWASWCAPCKASFPAMDELYQQFSEEGLVVLAVNLDKRAKDRERFLSAAQPSFPVVADPAFSLAKETGMLAMPTSYLVGRDGRIVSRHEGWQGESTARELRKRIEVLLEEPP